jgi:ornithine cyclodeaminase/alanine dehydrogenase-like protein (mu-crystallin family)
VTLLLTAEEAEGLLGAHDAIEVTRGLVLDYVAGSTEQMQPFGGYGGSGRTALPRVAAGVMYGRGRMNIRGGDVSMLYEISNRRIPIAIMAVDVLDARVSGSVGLAASYLARSDARILAVIGSSNVARGVVLGACAVRPIAEIRVYSTTPAHRDAFAEWARGRVGVECWGCSSLETAIEGADIIATATNTRIPLLTFEQLRPGTLALALGSDHELDDSIYLQATQLVATSQSQMLAFGGSGQAGQGSTTPLGPLAKLLEQGALRPDALIDLGALVRGDVPSRNGPADVTVYLDSRGGVADAALANAIYERARALGIGTDFDFQLVSSAGARRTVTTTR